METVICPHCGRENPPDSAVCLECGSSLREREAPPEAAAPAPDTGRAPETEETKAAEPAAPEQAATKQPAWAWEPPALAPRPEIKEDAPPPVPAYSYPEPEEDDDRPAKKSKYAPMSAWGVALAIFLLSVPVLGFILMIVWSCGGCRKIARRNLARGYLILAVIGLILFVAAALVARFCYTAELTALFEYMVPGYTIQWN